MSFFCHLISEGIEQCGASKKVPTNFFSYNCHYEFFAEERHANLQCHKRRWTTYLHKSESVCLQHWNVFAIEFPIYVSKYIHRIWKSITNLRTKPRKSKKKIKKQVDFVMGNFERWNLSSGWFHHNWGS